MSFLITQEEFTKDNEWVFVTPQFHYTSYREAKAKQNELDRDNTDVRIRYMTTGGRVPPYRRIQLWEL